MNYNTSTHVIDCIQSLSGEALNKIVVIDNDSPNDNPDTIKLTFPEIVLIKNSKNVGFGEGCNAGIRWALDNTDAEFILFLNPDTLIKPGLISELEGHLNEKEVGIAAPLITRMQDIDSLWYGGGNFSWLKGSARVPGYGKSANAPLAQKERDVKFASGCAFMTKRSVLEKCGLFDSRYFMYEEDVEFSLRVIAEGYRIRYVPTAIIRHTGQGSLLKEGKTLTIFSGKNLQLPFFIYHSVKNRFLTVYKHGSATKRLIFYIGFTAWISLKSLSWIRYCRPDAFAALYRGLRDVAKVK